MLWRVTDIQDYSVWATDGDIGELDQFYIDVNNWAVRYLVVDTGAWLPGRKVLVPMIAVQSLDRWGVFHLSLARAQLRHCPPVDPNRPISRAVELDYIRHYGLPLDWGITAEPSGAAMAQPAAETNGAPYLLSTRELAGLQVRGPGARSATSRTASSMTHRGGCAISCSAPGAGCPGRRCCCRLQGWTRSTWRGDRSAPP